MENSLWPREVERTPASARDPLVALRVCLHSTDQADEGAGRGPGGPPYLRSPSGIPISLLVGLHPAPTAPFGRGSVTFTCL